MSKAILVAGLAYGDEGKGATVDFLCRQLAVDLVVRYNGGSQAAHNVVTPEGLHHTFSQFGSGMLANDYVRTHLSRFMLVDPLTMMNEASRLKFWSVKPWERTTVDPRCVVITPFHKRLNRLREQARGDARHGSCGMGVGAARELALKYGSEVLQVHDLTQGHDFLLHMILNTAGYMKAEIEQLEGSQIQWSDFRAECAALARKYAEWPVRPNYDTPTADLVVFEGAQGVLLDETHGEEPHRTWTDCTFRNADMLCDEADIEDKFRIGCLRTYLTRHGAGPLRNEMLGVEPRDEHHNETNEWQGSFRMAPFDFGLVRSALDCIGKVDCIALSHLDSMMPSYKETFVNDVHNALAPVGITAYGPTAIDRKFNDSNLLDWAAA